MLGMPGTPRSVDLPCDSEAEGFCKRPLAGKKPTVLLDFFRFMVVKVHLRGGRSAESD